MNLSQQKPLSDGDTLRERVESAIEPLRCRLNSHAGDVEVVSAAEGEVLLEFTGACATCPAKATTFAGAVLPVLEKLTGVDRIAVKEMNVSSAALNRIRAMFAG